MPQQFIHSKSTGAGYVAATLGKPMLGQLLVQRDRSGESGVLPSTGNVDVGAGDLHRRPADERVVRAVLGIGGSVRSSLVA
jgi:hypothetical protein